MKKVMRRIFMVVMSLVLVFSTATLALACGKDNEPPATIEYTVTLGGEQSKVAAGGTYTLPASFTPDDADFEFERWNIVGDHTVDGNVVTVNGDLTITAVTRRKAAAKIKDGTSLAFIMGDEPETITVSEYITTHGHTVTAESDTPGTATATLTGGVVTVTPVAAGTATVTVSCDGVEITFSVNVTADKTPAFKNGTITFDLFETTTGSYTFEITEPQDTDYSYSYTFTPADTTGVSITGNTLTYTTTAVSDLVLNISVTATDATLGEKHTSFTVTVNVTDTRPSVKSGTVTHPTVHDMYNGALIINLADNINHANNVSSYKVNDVAVTGSEYEVTGAFTDTATTVTLNVEADALTYTYSVDVIDSTAYRMPNGGFENTEHGEGWSGMTGEFSDDDKYFTDGYDYNNDGWHYVGIDDGTETVKSPEFKVGNSGWITFKLGSMRPYDEDGVRDIYIEVYEKKADGDECIAKVRNVLFTDPERACKLNDYKLDLSDYKGETVYIKAVDNEDGSDFRSLEMDAFNTWWDVDPGNDYTDLSGLYISDISVSIDLASGDNMASVNHEPYSEGLSGATEILPVGEIQGGATGITLGESDHWDEITATACGTYTVVYKHDGVELFTATVKVVNTTVLPEIEDINVSYEYEQWCNDGTGEEISVTMPAPEEGSHLDYVFDIKDVTGGANEESFVIEGGEFKYTPAGVGTLVLTVETTVSDTRYTPSILLDDKIEFTITLVFKDNAITLKGGDAIELSVDVFNATDKIKYVVDFADYINVPSNKTATYSATRDASAVTLTESSKYTILYADETLSDTVNSIAIAVTATAGTTTLNYTVTVKLIDTTAYRLVNGDFSHGSDGLDGWTLSNPNIGGVNNAMYYWGERVPFGAEGAFFNAYTNLKDEDAEVAMSGDEGAKGTLTSSPFKIGGSGWITYRFGGAREKSLVYIEIVDSTTQEVLDRFGNELFSDADLGGCKLIKYKADLSAYIGRTAVIRITDNASANYGLFFADEFCTYYAQAPGADYNTATSYAHLKYKVANSSFEIGNLDGWTMTGDIGFISSANGYWGNENENVPELFFQKDGKFFFEGFEGKVTEGEGRKTGSLTSSTFVLGGSGFITFQMGAASHPDEQYFEVVDASNGAVLGRYTNTLYVDAGNAGPNGDPDKVSALTLMKYKVDLHEHVGKTLYVRIVDNHVGGGIGMIMFDNVETYYVSADDIGSDYTLTENKIVA